MDSVKAETKSNAQLCAFGDMWPWPALWSECFHQDPDPPENSLLDWTWRQLKYIVQMICFRETGLGLQLGTNLVQ